MNLIQVPFGFGKPGAGPVILWEDTSDPEEHACHVHPLGSTKTVSYWCGHTCADPICRRYKFVWVVTHLRAVYRRWRGLDYKGLSR